METTVLTEHVIEMTDQLGVNLTLIKGTKRAILIDTGYGLEAVLPAVDAVCKVPFDVVLTHVHHDHALGAMQMGKASLFPEELQFAERYTDEKRRRKILRDSGICPSLPDYLTHQMPDWQILKEKTIDLGGIHVRILHVPGHTPGSAMFLLEEERILITGDNWNPETWLFFPEACPLHVYKANMQNIMKLPFDQTMCSHRKGLFGREVLEAFLDGIRKDAIYTDRPYPDLADYPQIRPVEMLLPLDQRIVFDLNKWKPEML